MGSFRSIDLQGYAGCERHGDVVHRGGCQCHFTILFLVLEGSPIDMTQKVEGEGGRES